MTQLIAFVAEGSGSWFSGITDYLGKLNGEHLDVTSLGLGGVVVALVVVWFFVRVIRTLLSILFAICVLLVVLHFAGYLDLSTVWEQVSGLLGHFSEPTTPAAP